MERVIKVGKMPGAVSEIAIDDRKTVADALAIAGVSYSGFQVKVDGRVCADLATKTLSGVRLVLVTEQLKGNVERVIKVGKMPGAVSEIAIDSNKTVADALALAGVSYTGFQVKVDGRVVTNLSTKKLSGVRLVLVTEQLKGN